LQLPLDRFVTPEDGRKFLAAVAVFEAWAAAKHPLRHIHSRLELFETRMPDASPYASALRYKLDDIETAFQSFMHGRKFEAGVLDETKDEGVEV
jgi:hypothetical protein